MACHLAAVKGSLFEGIILESTFCGSHAPGAAPPEEPPQEAMASAPRFWTTELQQAAEAGAQLCRRLLRPLLEVLA